MKIGTSGIITNEKGQVLLIQRDDTRTFAPPGGSLDTKELPADGVAREVREETGLIVLPVRLVALYFLPIKPEGALNFVFRCIQRGGQLTPSPESPQVDFFWPRALPKPMFSLHRDRINQATAHQGGPVDLQVNQLPLTMRLGWLWLKFVIYPLMNRRRQRNGETAHVPAPHWTVTAVTIIRNQENHVLWLKRDGVWHLPGGENAPIEAPWQTAVSHTHAQTGQTIQLTNLSGVYIHPHQPEMTLAFTSNSPIQPKGEAAWFPPGAEPETASEWEKTAVADSISPDNEPVFRPLLL